MSMMRFVFHKTYERKRSEKNDMTRWSRKTPEITDRRAHGGSKSANSGIIERMRMKRSANRQSSFEVKEKERR